MDKSNKKIVYSKLFENHTSFNSWGLVWRIRMIIDRFIGHLKLNSENCSLAHFCIVWFSFFSSLHILHINSCQLCDEQRFVPIVCPIFHLVILLLDSDYFETSGNPLPVLGIVSSVLLTFSMPLPLPASKYFAWSFHLTLLKLQVLRCSVHLELIFP